MSMSTAVMSRAEYEQLVLDDPDGQWEIIRGRLAEKPAMSFAHNWGSLDLGYFLRDQLDCREYLVSVNSARLHNPEDSYVIPDVAVIPIESTARFRERPLSVEIYEGHVPLVAEFLSPSTGKYDVEGKLLIYQARGDREIWIVHPEKRTLTAYRRRSDGTYDEFLLTSGTISPIALPIVVIALNDILP